jgi:A/G-specific adenine glycosylase
MVSELMLQQTQTDRVVPKYRAFIKRFPTVKSLAQAPFREVVGLWQGLGYNRRAVYVHTSAQKVVTKYQGRFPKNQTELIDLPGIGPYTAAAIGAFAFNQPTLVLETNIRTVFIYTFFANHCHPISDQQLVPLVNQTLDKKNPAEWYSALMDLGAYIKKQVPNPSRRSSHYQRQSRFEGSNRQVRGHIIRILQQKKSQTLNQIAIETKKDTVCLSKIMRRLIVDGLVASIGKRFRLP